ncbi:mucoidy inhibitor MuiA family protein [Ktedonosporobacter rubrisoli]|uniref:Mucoidy inhibitor MuiA family protein n=1 Tax=Ktedonosporobacter rubrisoli TaxID=2509675 RepID=A0A4P6K0Y3_KTERU|nr:mucoidy inhibitor MuiA family protein [Ktedonosporobacter rubrisoli]QBD81848.1 mucoidy inhibitor MuiA family protein [Ktedonosporobacter rubrisoli]
MVELATTINTVTVYSDRALIARQGRINLEAGIHELRINNLPQFLHDSLRASGKGPQGTRILNVDITTAFHSQPPEADLLTLQTELELLRNKQQLIKARQNALQDRRHWLRSLGDRSKDFARGLAQGQMKPQDCADFFSFMAEQALHDAEAAQDLEIQMRQLQRDIDAKQRELEQKQGKQLPDRLAAAITIETAEAGEVELEISYLILNASWYPQYDVRVQMNEEQDNGEVEVTYVGMVQQSSGESWDNISLSLSTARPSLAAILPELDPWYLNAPPPVPRPAPMYAAAFSAPGGAPVSKRRTVPLDAINEEQALSIAGAATAPELAIAGMATATVEQTGTALVFRVDHAVDIPSDNSPHKTTIAHVSLPCSFDYVSAPVLEEQAHLRATIHNTTEQVLLNGSASIFLGGEYVGTTQIKTTVPDEKFKVFLGIDDRIKVKRELIERAVDKGNLLQSDIRRTTYAYRITVHNYANTPRHVIVRDHLPVPRHERIKVKTLSIQPQPDKHTRLEILAWHFLLPAEGEQKIEYRFTVEHPQSMPVAGLL